MRSQLSTAPPDDCDSPAVFQDTRDVKNTNVWNDNNCGAIVQACQSEDVFFCVFFLPSMAERVNGMEPANGVQLLLHPPNWSCGVSHLYVLCDYSWGAAWRGIWIKHTRTLTCGHQREKGVKTKVPITITFTEIARDRSLQYNTLSEGAFLLTFKLCKQKLQIENRRERKTRRFPNNSHTYSEKVVMLACGGILGHFFPAVEPQ